MIFVDTLWTWSKKNSYQLWDVSHHGEPLYEESYDMYNDASKLYNDKLSANTDLLSRNLVENTLIYVDIYNPLEIF